MCRHVGYLGPPRTLHALIYEGPHSLEHQSYAPTLTTACLLNADGFGAGWYPGRPAGARPGRVAGEVADAAPVRFRRAQPIWTDVSFREVAGVIETSCAVAAVRSATAGFPVDESCAQPFRADHRLFSHNGLVEDFAGVEAKLRDLAGDLAPVPDARAPVDSALLFAFAVRLWRSGAGLAEGIAEAVTTIAAIAPGRYNLLAADGESLAATTWGDSLFVRRENGATMIASEPYDDGPGWEPVPDHSLVRADPSGLRIDPL